jgi:hypothetical protein
MKSVKGQRALQLVAGAWCVVAAGFAHAEGSADFTLGVTHTDNVGRTRIDEQSETIGTAGLGLSVDMERPRLSTAIGANLEYRDYIDESFDSEVVGGLDGSLTYAFVIDRFLWSVDDNYGQIAQDRTLADSPDNRQNFNYFSTGPDIIVPFGAVTSGQASGRWSDTYYEDGSQDSQALSGSLALVRMLSEQTSVSLNGSISEVTYDQAATPDSTITEGFLRYASTGSRTTLSTDVGYTEAKNGDEEADGGFLFRATVSRQIGARSSVSLEAGSEFSDTGTAFRLDQDALGVQPESSDALASSDVFRNTYLYLTSSFALTRTTFTGGLRASQERYQDQIQQDRDIFGATVGMQRRMSPRFTFDVTGAYSKEEFKVGKVVYNEWSANLGLSWQMNRDWSLIFGAGHYDGSGDGLSRDYDENRASLSLRYSIVR